ncbi:MAG: ABC transporter permease [Fimbriimonadaceae bacterium]
MMDFLSIGLRIVQFTAPTAFAAIGETIGQRTGVLNIGLEGTMLVSAFTAVVVSGSTGSVWAGLIVAVLVGLLLTLTQAYFTVVLASDQVVAGTAVNLFGLGLTSTLFDLGTNRGQNLSNVAGFPKLFELVDPVLISLPVLGCLAYRLLFRTEIGLAMRAAGEYPPAVESAGFSVVRLRLIGQTICGGFAGLAGAYLTLGISHSFVQNMTTGRGFIAIALVTFGRWKPGWVLAASMLIGFLEWLQFAVQGKSMIPTQFFLALPYLVALVVLVVVGKGTQQPQNLGVPFRRSE